jgi:Flp pilus assembly protein TadG
MRSSTGISLLFACALSRFRRNRDGSVAVQFSLIAVPFLLMLFAIFETALVFFANQALETAVQDSARQIMTGQVQMANKTAAQFKNDICLRIVALFDCANGVDVNVQSYSSFATVDVSKPVDSSGNYIKNTNFQPGHAGDIVVVRAAYRWPLFVTGLGFSLGDVDGKTKRLLVATAAFRNEPGPF